MNTIAHQYVADLVTELTKRGYGFSIVNVDHLFEERGRLTPEQFAIEAIVRHCNAMEALRTATATPELLAEFQTRSFFQRLEADVARGFTRD